MSYSGKEGYWQTGFYWVFSKPSGGLRLRDTRRSTQRVNRAQARRRSLASLESCPLRLRMFARGKVRRGLLRFVLKSGGHSD